MELMLPPLTDPTNPPLVEVGGAEEALRIAARGYRVLWIEETPEALHRARRLMMAQPFLIQNRIEGIILRLPAG
jgi:hypothetical protein